MRTIVDGAVAFVAGAVLVAHYLVFSGEFIPGPVVSGGGSNFQTRIEVVPSLLIILFIYYGSSFVAELVRRRDRRRRRP